MTQMATTVGEVREAVRAARRRGDRVGLVPTMGALHAGHVSLLRAARAETEFVVVSVFVNPTQFDDASDLGAYPRPLEADLRVAREEGADLVFAPSEAEMYGDAPWTTVHVAGLTESMCGARRPGHFDGVCTVVAKLFNIAEPDVAYFGEKDAQQLAVVARMAADLNFPVRIRPCPLVRDADGLAASSRNARLSAEARAEALAISRALATARERIEAGERDAATVRAEIEGVLDAVDGLEPEYVAVVDPDTLEPLARIEDRVLVATAVRVGKVRLIDNCLLREVPEAGA